ncbi:MULTISPECIES: polysaccharide deacetylase family protein [unclassified Sporolactobacillus]|uniref:polysaccharide deacetylase family protein n=1 Tax=unclassified Sporolactobacillus TaxID=2628533 RepID=UPI0023680CBD|nr:polysaccharide deacetylase family protein [Sporolactobacillus sp. CQH2019]MDD9150160.1 polysaccharide deacetylase [Sporolactobacillus sp. CQH2019]
MRWNNDWMRMAIIVLIFFNCCFIRPINSFAAGRQYKMSGGIPDPVYKMSAVGRKKICYLTFDDGPSAFSNRIMDLLDRYHAKATFFVLGPNVIKYPQSVRRMAREGFTIGLHGISHDYKKLYRSEESLVGEMKEDQKIVRQAAHITTPFIRVPYGSYVFMKAPYYKAVTRNGFIMWDWNVDSQDWRYRDQRFVQRTIQQIQRLEEKKQIPVILLHDRATTYQSFELLLQYLQRQGYQMKRINASMHPLQFPKREHS